MTDIIGPETSTKTASPASSFLTALNSSLSGSATLGNLFNSLLADVQQQAPQPTAKLPNSTTVPLTTQNATNVTSQAAAPNKSQASSTTSQRATTSTTSSKDAPSSSDAKTHNRRARLMENTELAAAPVATSTTQPVQTIPVQSIPKVDPTTGVSQAATTTATPNDSTNQGSQPSLSDVLADLRDALQALRQIEQNNSHASASATATTATPTTIAANTVPVVAAAATNTTAPPTNSSLDPTASPLQELDRALVALQQLAQSLQTKGDSKAQATLESPASVNTNQDKTSLANVLTPVDPTSADAQLAAGLKSVLESLKATPAANTNLSANESAAKLQPLNTNAAPTDPTSTLAQTNSVVTDNSGTQSTDSVIKQLNTLLNAVTSGNTPAVLESTPVIAQAPTAQFAPVLETQASLVASVAKSDAPTHADVDSDPDSFAKNSFANDSFENPTTNSSSAGASGTKSTTPYTFASQLSASHASSNTGASGLSPAVEQVMFQLSRTVKAGNDQMTLQLHPADLGTINIKLNFAQDGSVQGTIIASSPATLEILQKDQHNLQQALQDAGLPTNSGSLQFSLGGQQQSSFQKTADQSSVQQGSSASNTTNTGVVASAETESWVLTPGRVNMKV